MPRIYTVEFENQTLNTGDGDVDLFEIIPATNQPVELLGLFIGQSSEVGEAEEEQLRFKVIRGHTTSSDGTAATPAALNPAHGAAGFTAEVIGATVATAGTPIDLHSDVWPVRVGYQILLPEGFGWGCSAAQSRIVVRMMSTVADAITGVTATLYVAG